MSSVEDLQRPLLSPHTDEKVDPLAKVERVPSDQLPPSYQTAASEAGPPPPPDAESRCCRHRRRCRRFGHFFIALFFLWLTAHYIVRHCRLRRFERPHHPHADDSDSIWVRNVLVETELN